MSQALKVAVIGVGHLGKWHAASPDCKLLAVVDNNLQGAEKIAQKHGIQAYSNYHNILSHVDVVSLAVPTSLHYKIARDILEAGIHCLIEKMITETVEDPSTLNIDPQKVEAAATARTRAILPVHLFGQAAGMDELRAIADKIQIYRNHGSSRQYHHDIIGYNSRLDELQAVILRTKLKHIDEFNQNRLRVALTYNRLLANTKTTELPVTETVCQRCLSLPIFPEMTDHQVQTVCKAI